jgi:sigma-B regulation protein RsbU (phosphoserine phosphatase)
VHSKPDRFNEGTAGIMTATADHIGIVLDNVKLYDSLSDAFHQLEKAKETIEAYSSALSAELEKGRHMQRTFLPEQIPHIPGWKIEACFYPAKQVSGDFYDLFQTGNQQLGIIIADVCDKGVCAALFVGIFRSLIHAYLEGAHSWNRQAEEPQKYPDHSTDLSGKTIGALSFLNHYIQRHHGNEGIFATLFLGILNTPDGHLDYINAGHEPLMIIGRDGIVRELSPTGPAIGISSEARFELRSARLDHGETLIGFTDGVTDACRNGGNRFCRTGVRDAVKCADESDENFMQCIIDHVFDHLGGYDLTDDIAMISISRLQEAS